MHFAVKARSNPLPVYLFCFDVYFKVLNKIIMCKKYKKDGVRHGNRAVRQANTLIVQSPHVAHYTPHALAY